MAKQPVPQQSLFIDNTQYTAFMRCQAYWYEKYVAKIHKPYEGERDDALAIGIAVHDALEAGYKGNGFNPSDKIMGELNLSHEAQLEVRSMCEHYRQAYPAGPVEFEWAGLEDPLTKQHSIDGHDITLLAKVDGWFRVDKLGTISGGIGDIVLYPGIYSFETKTKRSGYDRGLYIAEWQSGLQASFQMLTMKANAEKFGFNPSDVRGVLVNVIERPKVYTPRRTCLACQRMEPLKHYTQDGKQYKCMHCGNSNLFKGPTPTERVDPPLLYRFMVDRGEDRLKFDLDNISNVALKMNELRNKEVNPLPNATACVNTQWRSLCEYYAPHNNSSAPTQATGWPGFVQFNPTAYVER